jgi:murein L,D-transpeptidase YcbB/YkuD
MRTNRFDRLLTGTILALATSAPLTSALSAPNSLHSAPPPPAMLRSHTDRGIAQTPPSLAPSSMQRSEPDAMSSRAQVTQPAAPQAQPAPAEVAPEPAKKVETDSGSSVIKSAIDKMFSANDQQITEKMRELVTGKRLDNIITHAPERTAAENFYKARGYAPLWIKDGALTARAKAAIARLNNAAADALDPADYPVPEFGSFGSAEALAEGDAKLTNSVLTYARHLEVGRIAPTRVSTEVDYGNHTPDPADVLRKVADANNVDSAFESFNPPQAGFKALKEKLAALRSNASADEDSSRIPGGHTLKVGMKDDRVPLLREKLHIDGKPGDTLYDVKLAKAVMRIQASADLPGKGFLDNKTVAAINGPKPSQQINTIEANMERWRWLPRDLGKTYVMVNIPDYTLKVVRDNDVVWRTKIVSGKPQTPTPLLTAPMQQIIVNPSWYVPQSIIQNELLPQYANDPQIFDRMGLEVKRGPDGNINVIQPPGAANALGRIKFAFPNKFQVYLHDTPEKRLFASEKRAFSHGCMRVEDPTKFGEVMLHLAMNGPMPNSPQINAMFGHDEKTFQLQNRPMVHLTYQTAYVDDGGKLVIRDDIYGFDARVHAIMTTDERKIADVAPPKDPKRDVATAKSNQEILRRVERREAANPLQFFERLFR